MSKDKFFDLNHIWYIFSELPKPIYLHCSAGVMRSRDLAEKLFIKYKKAYDPTGDLKAPLEDFGYDFWVGPRATYGCPSPTSYSPEY